MSARTIHAVVGVIILALSLSLYLMGSLGNRYAAMLAVGMFIGFALIFSAYAK
ncbi:MAG: hypothetical protein WC685_03815 [Methylobacter sp.]|jgi:hypothetical protein